MLKRAQVRFLELSRRATLALSALLAATVVAQDAGAQSTAGGGVVYCHDEARDTVRVTRAEQCAGRVVSAAEAERIRAARDARTQRIIGEQPRAGGANVAPPVGRRGSGFFIGSGGLVLTNRHVVDRCRTISITTAADETLPAQLRAIAESDDIALLAIARAPMPFARFSSTLDATSDALVIVGYPQGSPTPRVATLSRASRGTVDLAARQPFYAIPGAVQPGNSGSPVLDQAGHVVGMVVARIVSRRALPGAQPQTFVGVIPISTITAFLALNHVRYESAPPAEEWTNNELLNRARQFVAQVNCTL